MKLEVSINRLMNEKNIFDLLIFLIWHIFIKSMHFFKAIMVHGFTLLYNCSRPKEEVWFDNVDEIFIEAAAEKTRDISKEESSTKADQRNPVDETEAKLVKTDSFSGCVCVF